VKPVLSVLRLRGLTLVLETQRERIGEILEQQQIEGALAGVLQSDHEPTVGRAGGVQREANALAGLLERAWSRTPCERLA
jgi:hypothetical protein